MDARFDIFAVSFSSSSPYGGEMREDSSEFSPFLLLKDRQAVGLPIIDMEDSTRVYDSSSTFQ
jgi:hypothetical protein